MWTEPYPTLSPFRSVPMYSHNSNCSSHTVEWAALTCSTTTAIGLSELKITEHTTHALLRHVCNWVAQRGTTQENFKVFSTITVDHMQRQQADRNACIFHACLGLNGSIKNGSGCRVRKISRRRILGRACSFDKGLCILVLSGGGKRLPSGGEPSWKKLDNFKYGMLTHS